MTLEQYEARSWRIKAWFSFFLNVILFAMFVIAAHSATTYGTTMLDQQQYIDAGCHGRYQGSQP